jgi:hypothetical protein
MKFNNKKLSTLTPWFLAGCFFVYTFLSYVLLFRDKRALTAISTFYPEMSNFLFSSRDYLLHHSLNTIPTFIFGIVSLLAIFYYLKSLTIKISLKKTIWFAILFQLITFVSYPILSTDIFSYMFSERVSTVHHENIWHVKPAIFPNDSFSAMADWKDTTSIYGGVNYVLYLVPALLGKDNVLMLLTLYKLLPALFAIGSGYMLYILLKQNKSDYVEKGLRLVFWNPLFVLEIFGSGHNDSIMIFFTLVSYYFFQKKQWLLAGSIVALAVQVKLLPIVLCFFFVYTLFKQKKFVSSVLLLIGFLVINALLFLFMQISPIDFLQRVLYNGGVYWQSLPNLLRYFVQGGNLFITAGFLVWVFFFIFKQGKKQINPLYSYAMVLLVYLLFVSAAYWNWYVIWIVALLPLINDKKLTMTTLLFSFTSLLAYPLLWLSLRFGYQSLVWPFVTYFFIFGIPIVSMFPQISNKLGLERLFAEKEQH